MGKIQSSEETKQISKSTNGQAAQKRKMSNKSNDGPTKDPNIRSTNLDTGSVRGQDVLLRVDGVLLASELGEAPEARDDDQLTSRELANVKTIKGVEES